MASPPPIDPSVPAAFAVIAEQYRLIRKLGEGAFGEVYLARHDLLGQEFAVKILKPELCEDPNLRDRFLDEARALIRFSHPNVVQLRHVGEHAGRLYLVMDLIRGEPLADILRRDGAFEEKRAVGILHQILSGLEAAHAAGIIHRDLKPTNLIVEKRPDGGDRVLILDFGLSKLSPVAGQSGAHRSVSGTVVGTLAYMSPEQLSGEKDLDGRSDLFAAGLILLEMLQGHHPYPGESGIVVAAKLLRDPVPPLDSKRAERVSETTRGALSTALQRDRDARYPSAVAFAQALQGKGPPSDTSKVTTIDEARRELARQEAAARPAATGRKSKAPLVAVVVVLLAGGAAAFFALGAGGGDGGEREPPVAPTPPPVDPTPPPVDTTPPPVDPTPPPVDPTPPPVDPTPSPVDPTPPPVDPTPPPVDPTPPPVDPTPPPVDPAPPPVDPTPPPVDPTPPPVDPTPPPESLTPEARLARAQESFDAGRWAEARADFLQVLATDPRHEKALPGVGASFVRQGDRLARSGKIPEALAAFAEGVKWLSDRYGEFEKQAVTDPEGARIPLGLSRTWRGEVHTEMARWHRIAGNAAKSAEMLKEAADDFQFAFQYLQRDSTRYWEFLLRRAEWNRFSGRLEEATEDLAITTATNNTEVPPHMWVAHAVAVRRLSDAALAKGDRPGARRRAAEAMDIAKRGQAWQRTTFSREHYLEAARVLWTNAALSEKPSDRVPLLGLIKYWVEEAEKKPALGGETEPEARAAILTAKAMVAEVQGLVFKDEGKATQSRSAFEEARRLCVEAVKDMEAAAAAGGALPRPFPHEVLGAASRALGDEAAAKAAYEAAKQAAARNPE